VNTLVCSPANALSVLCFGVGFFGGAAVQFLQRSGREWLVIPAAGLTLFAVPGPERAPND
jgi:hypothetical protein